MANLNKFIRASDRVVEFSSYFSSIAQDDHTVHSLEIQRDEITHLWSVLRTTYDDLLAKIDSSKDDVSVETIRSKFFVAYNSHIQCLSKANQLLETLRLRSTHSQTESKPSQTAVERINLPPCDMEIFYGDYESWPTFRDQFSALYGEHSHISPVEKLCHLLKKTKGEAHEIVRSCPFTNAGFQMAWQNLIDRYENKRVLVNAQLKTLFSMSHINKESGPAIKTLQRTINNCISNLTLLQINTDNWDVIFVYIGSTCLPDITLNLWEQSLKDNTDLPKWKDMDAFLSSRFHTLESVSDIRSSNVFQAPTKKNLHPKTAPTNNPFRKINSFHTNISQNRTGKCSLCPDCHPLRLCPNFLHMSVDERFKLIKKQGRCTNCLATSHEYKVCKSQYACAICKQRHHSLLHRSLQPESKSFTPLKQNTSFAEPPNVNCHAFADHSERPSTSAEAAQTRHSYSTHLKLSKTPFVLLGTALVTITVGDLACTVRALIDPASEASFISKSLQKKLALSSRSSQTNVIGLGDTLATTSSQIGQIQIKSPMDPSFSASIEVFVVEKLIGKLAHYPMVSSIKSDFADLPMADQINHQASPIDLLLGGDIYPRIIREGVRWNKAQTLIAQQSVFGWIITGRTDSSSSGTTVSSFFNKVDINHLLSRFWELEEVPAQTRESDDDKYVEKLYKRTTYRNDEGRFVVSLPFLRSFPIVKTIGQSRNTALS